MKHGSTEEASGGGRAGTDAARRQPARSHQRLGGCAGGAGRWYASVGNYVSYGASFGTAGQRACGVGRGHAPPVLDHCEAVDGRRGLPRLGDGLQVWGGPSSCSSAARFSSARLCAVQPDAAWLLPAAALRRGSRWGPPCEPASRRRRLPAWQPTGQTRAPRAWQTVRGGGIGRRATVVGREMITTG